MKKNYIIIILIIILVIILSLIFLYISEAKKKGEIIDDCGYTLSYNNVKSIGSVDDLKYEYPNHNYRYSENPPEECSNKILTFHVRKTMNSAFGFGPSRLDITFYKNSNKISRSAWIANALNSYEIRYREYDKIKISFKNNMAIYTLLRDQGHNKIYDSYYFIFSPKNENVIEISCEGGSEYPQGIPLCDETVNNLRFSDGGTTEIIAKEENEFFDSLQECNENSDYQTFYRCYLLKLNETSLE